VSALAYQRGKSTNPGQGAGEGGAGNGGKEGGAWRSGAQPPGLTSCGSGETSTSSRGPIQRRGATGSAVEAEYSSGNAQLLHSSDQTGRRASSRGQRKRGERHLASQGREKMIQKSLPAHFDFSKN